MNPISGFAPEDVVQFVWRARTSLPFFFRASLLLPRQLANARQGIANEHVDDSAAAIARRDQYGAGGLFANFADESSFDPAGHRMKRVQSGISEVGSYDR